jgi:hypothetical protein
VDLFREQAASTPREPIILYSANTWLAYAIAERYYRGEHYVWCTPYFDASSVAPLNYTVPPSSSPIEIYRGLRKDVLNGDRHSAKIAANKAGIVRGMEAKLSVGAIDDEVATEIASVIGAADILDFRPLLYVIPFHVVRDRLRPVPVRQRAHPMSVEFIIETLPRECFDVIGLEGI